MDLINAVAAVDFAERHPELHHYTTFDGLKGIHESRTLWVVNYRQLNDRKEITLLKAPLVEALTKRFKFLLEDRQNKSPQVRRAIEMDGSSVASIAADQARRMVTSFYDTLLRTSGASLEPYVASFCTHANDHYAREHGLLSQWRGYGAGGGFCIVFDTAKLIDLLKQESNAHYWVMPLKIGQVYYHTPDFSLEGIFGSLLDEADKLFSALLDNTVVPEIVMAYFLWVAPLLKHQGFREENEARIVAIPATRHDLDGIRTAHGEIAMPPFKTVHVRDSARGTRQFMALFESFRPVLPIKRVIIGPSQHQDEEFAKARQLLGDQMRIERSDTPFIG
jgi:hypothetical protein